MSLQHHYRPINPRLGTHYAIIASAITAIVLVLAMLEQLGARKLWLSHAMFAAPILLYAGVAILTRTLDVQEFFAAGRRVPAVFGGLSMAVTVIGGTGFFALTGCLYLIGFDALAIALGWGAGLVVTVVLFTPFLRKSGAYTLPGFFRQRFASPWAGALAALLLVPPVVLLLAAELRMGAFVTSLFASVSFEEAIAIGAVFLATVTVLGGLRSVSWTLSVQYVVVIAAFLLPLVILAVTVTNLPVPQLTYGDLLQRLSAQEVAIGAARTEPMALAQALPGEQPEAAVKPFLEPFGALSTADFIMLAFCFMAGTAVMPTLLSRAGTSPTLFEARRAVGWGSLFLGLFLISAPAYAVFAKFLTLQELVGTPLSRLPGWIAGLRDAGLADISDRNGDGVISASEVLVSRDGVTLALPIMAGFPFVVTVLVAAGGVAATLAASAAHALTVGAAIGEDVFRGLIHPSATPGKRMIAARLGTLATLIAAAWFVSIQDFDILPAVAWSMSLAAGTFLPALALSVWWPRMTLWGLLAAMAAGFGVALAHIVLSELGDGALLFGLSGMLAGIVGIPAGFAAGIGVSHLTPRPSDDIRGIAREIRDPTGETMLDRAVRLSVPVTDETAPRPPA